MSAVSVFRFGLSSTPFAIPKMDRFTLTYMGMGKRIRQARTEAGYDQSEFAKAVGMSQSALSEVESGESKEPRASSFWRMVRLLQLSPRWLAEGKGPMKTQDAQETELLDLYRALDDRSRRVLIASAKAMKLEDEDRSAEEIAPSRQLHVRN